MPKTPSYRTRPGYTQVIVTLTDSATKRRRDYWLGPAGSRESREKYHRLIAEWEAAGRRLPDIQPADSVQPPASPAAAASPPGSLQPQPISGGVLLSDIIVAYWKWAVGRRENEGDLMLRLSAGERAELAACSPFPSAPAPA